MSSKLYGVLLTVFAVAMVLPVCAQDRHERMMAHKARLDSILTERRNRGNFDTNYVVRPKEPLTVKARVNVSGYDLYAKGTVKDDYAKADLHTSHTTTVSVGASYMGLSLSLSLNHAKLFGRKTDYNFNLNYYSPRINVEATYSQSETLSGDIKYGDGTQYLEEGMMNMRTLNVAAYYSFNYRRFSYPAAFTQSMIQRHSAGSWLAGLSYEGGRTRTNTSDYENLPDIRIYMGHIGIGGGYAYNFVLRNKWLIHLSALPTFVVYNRNNMTIDGVKKKAERIRLNMIFNERLAVVYNFTLRFFAGATLVMSNSLFDDSKVTVNQNRWRARGFIGVRF